MNELEATHFRLQLMALHRRLRTEHVDDLALQGILALGAIDRLGELASPSALAVELKVARSNMSALLRQLESGGWVATTHDPQDGRRRTAQLTEQGRRLLERDRGNRELWLRTTAQEVLSTDEVELLLKAGEFMQRLAEAPLRKDDRRREPR